MSSVATANVVQDVLEDRTDFQALPARRPSPMSKTFKTEGERLNVVLFKSSAETSAASFG